MNTRSTATAPYLSDVVELNLLSGSTTWSQQRNSVPLPLKQVYASSFDWAATCDHVSSLYSRQLKRDKRRAKYFAYLAPYNTWDMFVRWQRRREWRKLLRTERARYYHCPGTVDVSLITNTTAAPLMGLIGHNDERLVGLSIRVSPQAEKRNALAQQQSDDSADPTEQTSIMMQA